MEMEAARCWLVIGDGKTMDLRAWETPSLALEGGGRGCLYILGPGVLGSSGELATRKPGR